MLGLGRSGVTTSVTTCVTVPPATATRGRALRSLCLFSLSLLCLELGRLATSRRGGCVTFSLFLNLLCLELGRLATTKMCQFEHSGRRRYVGVWGTGGRACGHAGRRRRWLGAVLGSRGARPGALVVVARARAASRASTPSARRWESHYTLTSSHPPRRSRRRRTSARR